MGPSLFKSLQVESVEIQEKKVYAGNIAKMIGQMKYKANSAKNISDQEKSDAAIALAKYGTITNKADRDRFIRGWQDGVLQKGGDGFKFAHSFEKGLIHEDKVEIGSEDQMITRIVFFIYFFPFCV